MLALLKFALFLSPAFASEAKRSTSQGSHFSELGLNANHRHCENSHDVALLYSKEHLNPDEITPVIELELDEATGSVEFSVEVYYLPRDAYYQISIGTRCFSRPFDETAEPDTDTVLSQTRSWGHAPNALYTNALNNSDLFGAYYVDPETGWKLEARGCSHVIYRAKFSAEQLVNYCGVDYADGSTFGVRALSSLVNVQLAEIDGGGFDWPAPFSLYVDSMDSSVLLHQTAVSAIPSTRSKTSRTNSAVLNAVARSISVDSRNALGIVLQTQQASEYARTLWLDSIFAHRHEPSFELDIGKDPEPPRVVKDESGVHKTTVQDWKLVSHSHTELFDGDFTLHLCVEGSKCAPGKPDYTLRLLVRIANADTPQQHSAAVHDFHSEISQHLEVHNDEEILEGDFDTGARACMQTYVLGPEKLTSKLSLDLEEAWLCTDVPETTPINTLACPDAQHRVLLYSANGTDATRDVTVHIPGVYGRMSVAVCFDVSALFSDDNHVSVIRKAQRYESRVRVGTYQFRTESHAFMSEEPFYRQLDSINGSQEELGFATAILSQWRQHAPFSRYRLATALSDGAARAIDVHAHNFAVMPEQKYLHNIDNSHAVFDLIIIIAVFCCFITWTVACCISPRWRSESAESNASSRKRTRYV